MLAHGQIIFFVAIGWGLATAKRSGPVQVLSDVDDTILSSGGGPAHAKIKKDGTDFYMMAAGVLNRGSVKGRYAGCDGYYPHKAIYPGVGQFFYALAKRHADFVKRDKTPEVLNPALLSARPASLGSMVKMTKDSPLGAALANGVIDSSGHNQGFPPNYFIHDYDSETASEYGLNADGSMYGTEISTYHRDYKEDKENHIKKFLDDHRKLNVVFIGDDGQGDCVAGNDLVFQGGVKAIFIHSIRKQGNCLSDLDYVDCMASKLLPGEETPKLKIPPPPPSTPMPVGPAHPPGEPLPVGWRESRYVGSNTVRPIYQMVGANGRGSSSWKLPVTPMLYFDTYADAALKALKLDLISNAQANDIFALVHKFYQKNCEERYGKKIGDTHPVEVKTSDEKIITDGGCKEMRNSLLFCMANSQEMKEREKHLSVKEGERKLLKPLTPARQQKAAAAGRAAFNAASNAAANIGSKLKTGLGNLFSGSDFKEKSTLLVKQDMHAKGNLRHSRT